MAADWLENASLYSLLRAICRANGVQLLARTFNLGSMESPFTLGDIAALRPRVKTENLRHGRADAVVSVSARLVDAGETEAAMQNLLYARRAVETTLGPSHPQALAHMGSLVQLWAGAQQFGIAVEMQRSVIMWRELTLGWDHAQVLHSYILYSSLLLQAGEFREAFAAGVRALTLCRVVGPHHALDAGVLALMASAAEHIGEYSMALRLQGRMQERYEALYGKDSADIADICRRQMGICVLPEIHRLQDALDNARNALRIYKLLGGHEDDVKNMTESVEVLENALESGTDVVVKSA